MLPQFRVNQNSQVIDGNGNYFNNSGQGLGDPHMLPLTLGQSHIFSGSKLQQGHVPGALMRPYQTSYLPNHQMQQIINYNSPHSSQVPVSPNPNILQHTPASSMSLPTPTRGISLGNPIGGFPQYPVLRTREQLLEGDNSGNFRMRKKDSELSFESRN